MQRQESAHPEGELLTQERTAVQEAIEVDTFNGKLHVSWDSDAAVTP